MYNDDGLLPGKNKRGDGLLSFGEQLTKTANFMQLYRDGMRLVEDTASYLDGPGRQEARLLNQQVKLLFASESMRLTTYLMQLASWLLLHRSLGEDEMTLNEVRRNRAKLEFRCEGRFSDNTHDWIYMPTGLIDLIERAKRLGKRVHMLDMMIHKEEFKETEGQKLDPVNQQIKMLEKAFHGMSTSF